MYSQYLAFVYCEILLVLGVFQYSVLRILPYSQYFGVRYSGILLCLKYFGVRHCGILFVLEVFRDLWRLRRDDPLAYPRVWY